MSKIQINTHKRVNWTLEDAHGKLMLDATESASELDGFNIHLKVPGQGLGETWLDVQEAISLRDWLIKSLDGLQAQK